MGGLGGEGSWGGGGPPCWLGPHAASGGGLGAPVWVVVDVDDEPADRRVEFGQRQARLAGPVRGAAGSVPGQGGQAHLVDGVEVPLDLSAAARFALPGEHQADLQIDGDLFEVTGGEIRAVVRIEGVRDAADVPAGFALAPDRLA